MKIVITRFLTAAVIAISCFNVSAKPAPLISIAAIVNDDIITSSEHETELKLVRAQLRQQRVTIPPMDILRTQVLERLILNSIQMQMAQSSGLVADDADVSQALKSIAAQNKLTVQQFRGVLEKDGINFDRFRQSIREELTTRRLQQRHVDNRINVSEQEIDIALSQDTQSQLNTEYRLGHILISVDENANASDIRNAEKTALTIIKTLRNGADFSQTAAGLSAGEQALQGGDLGWRKTNELPTLFAKAVPQLKTGQVGDVIRSPSGFHIIKLLDQRSTDAPHIITQTHSRHILIKTNELVSTQAARKKLDALRQQLTQGADFAQLAKEHSDDSSSAINGGDLGWVSPGMMVPPFEAAVNALQPHQLSKAVQTAYGWHLIEVLARRQHDNTVAFKRQKIRGQIFSRKVEQARQHWMNRLRSEAYVEIR